MLLGLAGSRSFGIGGGWSAAPYFSWTAASVSAAAAHGGGGAAASAGGGAAARAAAAALVAWREAVGWVG